MDTLGIRTIQMDEVAEEAPTTTVAVQKPSREPKRKPKETGCPLKTRKFIPPEVVLGTHDILFVGWNPGADEVKQGRPFVGASGRLLRGWVKRLGLTDRVGYSNACFYRPPEGNREPTPQEVAGCAPINMRLIATMKPKLIVCLGAPFAKLFGFKGSVGSMVGRFKVHGDTLITVLYHPAYTIRLKGSKRFAEVETQTLEVLQEAIYRISGDREVEDYPRIHVEPVFLYHRNLIAVDTEHHGGLRGDGSPDPRRVILDSVQTYDGAGPVLIGPNLIASPRHPLVFHNAIHDLIVLSNHNSPQEHVVGDSMVAAWMLGRQNLSLKGLAWRELGASVIDYDEAAAKGGEVWDNYCAQDPVLTWRLHEKLYPELCSKGIDWLYDNVEMPLQPILAECSIVGLEVDHERVMALWGAMERRVEMLGERLRLMAGGDFNPDSPTQVLQHLRDVRGLKVKSTDSKVLAEFINDEFVQYLLGYRKAQKRISTYYRKLSVLRIISGLFNTRTKDSTSLGADTGRLSQTDHNLQNLPPDVKGCIKAREGYTFIYRDYSQIELRLGAFYSRDEYLLNALREGRNIHEELCLAVFGYRVPELYTRAKSANFERLYAGSLETRAKALGVSESKLASVEPAWVQFEAWAAAQKRQAHITSEARTYMGRMMVLHGIDSSDEYLRDKAERQAINMPEQGGATDICKYAMVKAQPWMKQLGGRVAHQEHDSILCEVPEKLAKEADEALNQAMTEAVPEEIREVIEIPSKGIISKHWG